MPLQHYNNVNVIANSRDDYLQMCLQYNQPWQYDMQLGESNALSAVAPALQTIDPWARSATVPAWVTDAPTKRSLEGTNSHSASQPSSEPKQHKKSKTRSDRQALQYVCGYCSRVKKSTSKSSDCRVRIRCECGGQQQDNRLRMHATWTLAPTAAPNSHVPSTYVSTMPHPNHSNGSNQNSRFFEDVVGANQYGMPPSYMCMQPNVAPLCTDSLLRPPTTGGEYNMRMLSESFDTSFMHPNRYN